jgi:ferredoxin
MPAGQQGLGQQGDRQQRRDDRLQLEAGNWRVSQECVKLNENGDIIVDFDAASDIMEQLRANGFDSSVSCQLCPESSGIQVTVFVLDEWPSNSSNSSSDASSNSNTFGGWWRLGPVPSQLAGSQAFLGPDAVVGLLVLIAFGGSCSACRVHVAQDLNLDEFEFFHSHSFW